MKRTLSPFGRKIRKALIDIGMKQDELAKSVGTTPAYLGMILFGERSGQKYRKKIIEVLNIEDSHKTDNAAS
ncbi:MAG: helix-turn-helix transcriptional regulator [Oscillospiraceae bacterium]